MNKSRFDEIIKNRADERVQKAIKDFHKELAFSLNKLLDGVNYINIGYGVSSDGIAGVLRKYCPALVGGKGYNIKLWSRMEESVEKELLATMDEFQKALLAPKPEGGEKPSYTVIDGVLHDSEGNKITTIEGLEAACKEMGFSYVVQMKKDLGIN